MTGYKSKKAAAQALAQPAQEPWCMKMNGCKTKCEDCPDEAALAQQEPVAWAVYCDGFIALPAFDDEQDALKEMQRRNKNWPQNKREVKALYDTTPPQRTWVGLTDGEIDEWTPEIHTVIRAIEAKLKEKNT